MKEIEKRPICMKCEKGADVLLHKGGAPLGAVFPFCDSHDPDPSEYGNKTEWKNKLVLRRYGIGEEIYSVFGRTGGETYKGEVIHIELPDSSDVLCNYDISDYERINLSTEFPEGKHLCGHCISTSVWWEDYSDKVVGRYLYALREVAKKSDQDIPREDSCLEYPELEPIEKHKCAEGIQN